MLIVQIPVPRGRDASIAAHHRPVSQQDATRRGEDRRRQTHSAQQGGDEGTSTSTCLFKWQSIACLRASDGLKTDIRAAHPFYSALNPVQHVIILYLILFMLHTGIHFTTGLKLSRELLFLTCILTNIVKGNVSLFVLYVTLSHVNYSSWNFEHILLKV